MDFCGVVSVSLDVAPNDALDSLNVLREGIPVPDAEMVELVPTKEKSLEMQRREEMIDLSHPLWHSVVVGVFGLEEKFKEPSVNARKQALRSSIEAAIGPNHAKRRVPVGDQSQANVVVCEGRLRCAEDGPNEIVVQIRGSQRELSLLKR